MCPPTKNTNSALRSNRTSFDSTFSSEQLFVDQQNDFTHGHHDVAQQLTFNLAAPANNTMTMQPSISCLLAQMSSTNSTTSTAEAVMPTAVQGTAIDSSSFLCRSELEFPQETVFDDNYFVEAEKDLLAYFAMQEEPQQATLAATTAAGLWTSGAVGNEPPMMAASNDEATVSTDEYSSMSNNSKRRKIDSASLDACFPPEFCNVQSAAATELSVQTMANNSSSDSNGYFTLVHNATKSFYLRQQQQLGNSNSNSNSMLPAAVEELDCWSPTPLCEFAKMQPMASQHQQQQHVDKHAAADARSANPTGRYHQFHDQPVVASIPAVSALTTELGTCHYEPIPVNYAPLASNLALSTGATSKIESMFAQQQPQQQATPLSAVGIPSTAVSFCKKEAVPAVVKTTDDILPVLSGYNFFFRCERSIIAKYGISEQPTASLQRDFSEHRKHEILAEHWNRDRAAEKKRKHRKEEGLIDFPTLSKIISKRWRSLSAEEKNFYRSLNKEDTKRYERQVVEAYMKSGDIC